MSGRHFESTPSFSSEAQPGNSIFEQMMQDTRRKHVSFSDEQEMQTDPPANPQPLTNHLPARPDPNPGSTLLSYLKDIITDSTRTDTNSNVNLDKTTVAVLLHLIESKAEVQKQLQEINARLESIE
ncbi:hypothetical protein VP01_2189g3, partial [Puccinia sorghi]